MSLTLYLLLLGPLRCSLAVAQCKEEEYPVGTECCPKCGPGFRVKEACGEVTGTLCVPCDPGTYTAHFNGLSECLQCRVCDPAMGLVTRQKCSTKNNTACICGRGHFCVSESRGDCAECRPHTACRPGQRVRERGTQWQDTVCEDCPPGTFSPNGALEQCQPWTKCNSSFQSLVNPGTSSSDVTCSASHSPSPLTIIIPILLLVGIIVPVAVTWIRMKRMKNRRSPGEATKERPLQAPPDVTTVATEETAFVS